MVVRLEQHKNALGSDRLDPSANAENYQRIALMLSASPALTTLRPLVDHLAVNGRPQHHHQQQQQQQQGEPAERLKGDDEKAKKPDKKLEGTIQIAARPVLAGDKDEEESAVELVPWTARLESFHRHQQQQQPPCQAETTVTLQFQDMVQSYQFRDFEGLEDFMEPLKERILKRHAATLQLVHQKFRDIVQEIVDSRQQFTSLLRSPTTNSSWSSSSWTNQVGIFATPNVRLKRGNYATFLHSDAVFEERKSSSSSSSFSMAPKAMMNVWMSLMDGPIPNFPLCFYESSRANTTFAENKLYYCRRHAEQIGNDATPEALENEVLYYDPDLQWGSFLCFVAGQPESDKTVLLHGAVDLNRGDDPGCLPSATAAAAPPAGPSPIAQKNVRPRVGNGKIKRTTIREAPRKSLEMRFVV